MLAVASTRKTAKSGAINTTLGAICGLIAGLLLFSSAALAQDALPLPDPSAAQATALGRYRVAFAPTIEPLAINRMHQWVIHIADADGRPVEGATLAISGGMPKHDHGLPTAPQLTRDLGDGNYLVEGMKFHMGGAWEIVVTVTADAITDSITWPLDL